MAIVRTLAIGDTKSISHCKYQVLCYYVPGLGNSLDLLHSYLLSYI